MKAHASWVAALSAALLLDGPSAAQSLADGVQDSWASFRCDRAASRAEKLICGDGKLGESDAWLSYAYGQLLRRTPPAGRAAVRAAQRQWIARRSACDDAACLTALYDARQKQIDQRVAAYDKASLRGIARVGQCQAARIEWIAGRLGSGPPQRGDHPNETGTSMFFSNGVQLISYDRIAAAARSRVDDTVRICLISIPRHCPPGDDRGRDYSVTNLRTHERWNMPDSQHSCGGA